MKILEAESVSKKYFKIKALDAIDMDIEDSKYFFYKCNESYFFRTY